MAGEKRKENMQRWHLADARKESIAFARPVCQRQAVASGSMTHVGDTYHHLVQTVVNAYSHPCRDVMFAVIFLWCGKATLRLQASL